jgi:hypothetical protein
MKTIYKYPLKNHTTQIELPKGAQVLSVINQENVITVYASVETENEMESVEFRIFGTGWDVGGEDLDLLKFVGTVQVDWLVWHVFYKSQS